MLQERQGLPYITLAFINLFSDKLSGRALIRLSSRFLEEAMIRMALDQRRRPFPGGAPWLSRQSTPANRVASARPCRLACQAR
jgi:hypothetical protein